ncbi:MAG: hypothetical protein EBQ57_00380 [Actinobacteria bacterium]|nr:hypothetical protein [Actinomycetota bacterium]
MTFEWGVAPPKQHVVIVGAGFGGLACARKLRRSSAHRVTMIDRHPYHLFSPLLYQVATAGLPEDDIAFPVRTAFREVEFIRAEVTAIDATAKQLTLNGQRVVDFDHLILAVGSQGTTYGIDGVAEHTLQMKSVADSRLIRRSLLHTYEEVEDGFLPTTALQVAVVGGGPTGVELAGAIRELQDEIRREFEDIAQHASVTLLKPDHGLAELSPQVECPRTKVARENGCHGARRHRRQSRHGNEPSLYERRRAHRRHTHLGGRRGCPADVEDAGRSRSSEPPEGAADARAHRRCLGDW